MNNLLVADRIYIPIWLDLLSARYTHKERMRMNLHSNMVRFIIGTDEDEGIFAYAFTFQYG